MARPRRSVTITGHARSHRGAIVHSLAAVWRNWREHLTVNGSPPARQSTTGARLKPSPAPRCQDRNFVRPRIARIDTNEGRVPLLRGNSWQGVVGRVERLHVGGGLLPPGPAIRELARRQSPAAAACVAKTRQSQQPPPPAPRATRPASPANASGLPSSSSRPSPA